MSLPRPHGKVRHTQRGLGPQSATAILRVVTPPPPDFHEEPTALVSPDYLREMAQTSARAPTASDSRVQPALQSGMRPPPLHAARSTAPLTATVVTRRPKSMVLSLWAAWLGAAGLFLGTAAFVLKVQTGDAPHASAAAAPAVQARAPVAADPPSAPASHEEVSVPAVPVRVSTPTAAPTSVAAKGRALRAVVGPSTGAPPAPPTPKAKPSGARASEIVRTLDFGNDSAPTTAAPTTAAPAKAAPANDTPQTVIHSADAELDAVVRAMK
jgi:hypothetical protein